MKIKEKEILTQIKNELSLQGERERKFWEKLEAPKYRKPNYRFWWVFAPLSTVAIALIILMVVPAPNNYRSLSLIDDEIFQMEDTINLLSSAELNVDIDRELEDLNNNIKLLKEEEL